MLRIHAVEMTPTLDSSKQEHTLNFELSSPIDFFEKNPSTGAGSHQSPEKMGDPLELHLADPLSDLD